MIDTMEQLADKGKLKIFIPARKGSKGLPYKNRLLFDLTINQIPEKYRKHVTVSSNDEDIKAMCVDKNISYLQRPEIYCGDNQSTLIALLHYAAYNFISNDNLILMLYLTYPQRKWDDVFKAYYFMHNRNAKSLLCSTPVKTHPYLCFYKKEDKGSPIINHDKFRRQDYPEVFKVEHYVSMFYVSELVNFHPNLYNDETVFMPLDKAPMNVDRLEDLVNDK